VLPIKAGEQVLGRGAARRPRSGPGDATEQPIPDPAADDQAPPPAASTAGDRPRRVERIGRRRTTGATGSLTARLPCRSACGRSAARCGQAETRLIDNLASTACG
jgi:hypothetical protein